MCTLTSWALTRSSCLTSVIHQIGKIKDIYQSGPRKEDIALKVVWYYRPEEAFGGRKVCMGAWMSRAWFSV